MHKEIHIVSQVFNSSGSGIVRANGKVSLVWRLHSCVNAYEYECVCVYSFCHFFFASRNFEFCVNLPCFVVDLGAVSCSACNALVVYCVALYGVPNSFAAVEFNV